MARKVKKTPRPEQNITPEASGRSAALSRRIVIIVVSVLLGAAILVGAVAGIVIGVRNASYLMYCNGVGIDDGVASYFVSYYKTDYIASLQSQGITVTDSPAFWAQKVHPDVVTTYADYLTLYVEDSIKNVISANSIFDSRFILTHADKTELAVATQEILTYRANGSEDTFNEMTAAFGFDYDDFVKATEMLYKAYMLPSRIFGGNGAAVADAYAPECEELFSCYARVSLLFIRTNNRYAYDDNGDYIIGEDGKYVTVDLSEEERRERLEDVEMLKGVASGKYEHKLLDDMWKKYEKENNAELLDCYLYEGSELTKSINEKFPLVTDILSGLDEYQLGYGEDVDGDDNSFVGYVFVYRNKPEEKAYLSSSDPAGSFDDFFDLVASYIYDEMLVEMRDGISVRDGWSRIDPTLIPYNTDFAARL